MNSSEIRQQFLTFFKAREHKIVPSAPIVVKNDPTLMFTNAGMNQFKDYFLGNRIAEEKRVADSQKCLRVSGKHNDLEEVGIDTYHHTMFEMLGNWSFGDYFKEEAIDWAWELLTRIFQIPEEKLYATIFGGDDADGLDADNEAYEIWKKYLPEERILRYGKKDNFWEMGDTGPCGPCSEIHIDLRSDEDKAKQDGGELVNADHPEVVEIWNLVFIQYNRKSDKSLHELPEKHVDTGMGFERLAMVMQGKKSTYDTDLFKDLMDSISKQSGYKYGEDEQIDIAFRVVSDHIRAIVFTVADGQLPSNTGAGYVIRRILRRAVRYAFQYLNIREPFLHKLVPVLAKKYDGVFPEIMEQVDQLKRIVEEEENAFLRTAAKGLNRYMGYIKEKFPEFSDAALIRDLKGKIEPGVIPGDLAFELYDTYGFPLDLTELMSREIGWAVDATGFEAAMQKQKTRSKSAAKVEKGDWVELLDDKLQEFVGYDYLESEIRIVRYRQVEEKGKTRYQVVFNLTPFYAESGGQVGDTGTISNGVETIQILNTVKENDITIHLLDKLPEHLEVTFKASVDQKKRRASTSNHSATHLLHAALRNILGDHVQQKGSLVSPDHLRFDFSHFTKVTDEEIQQIESMVNNKIMENILLDESRNVPYQKALDKGAMALFGEKYGDVVRVITFDPKFSVELCGGTHVSSTAEIGLFKILSESSIAAGIRRIEAVTAEGAFEYVSERVRELDEIKQMVKQPDVIKAVSNLIEENNKLKKEMQKASGLQVGQVKADLLNGIQSINGVNYIGSVVELDSSDHIKDLAYQLKNEVDDLFLVLGAKLNGKANITLMFSDNLVSEKELHAGNLIRELAKEIKGGGGGQPFFATAGGADPNGLSNVLEKTKSIVESL